MAFFGITRCLRPPPPTPTRDKCRERTDKRREPEGDTKRERGGQRETTTERGRGRQRERDGERQIERQRARQRETQRELRLPSGGSNRIVDASA
jgi:hypothetical protein